MNDVNWSSYSIDVLVVGSKHKVEQVQVQRETWASHAAERNFFISTEYDDVDPKCIGKGDAWSDQDIKSHLARCRTNKSWAEMGSWNRFAKTLDKDIKPLIGSR